MKTSLQIGNKGIMNGSRRIRTSRLLAGIITLAVLLPIAVTLSGDGSRRVPAASLVALPLVSTNAPAFTNNDCNGSFPASLADDGNYQTLWRSCDQAPSTSNPIWLAYDLSQAHSAGGGKLSRVVVAWNSDWMSGDYDTSYNKDDYNVPGTFAIQVNPAPGGTSAPTTGWVTAVPTITRNVYHSRQFLIDMKGDNWVRLVVTASYGSPGNTDVAVNMEVHDASQSRVGEPLSDDWIFYGDSITAGGMDHGVGGGTGSFSQLVNEADPAYYPVQEGGGIGYLTSSSGAANINKWLSLFPGAYVGLSYGTNDILGGCSAAGLKGLYDNYVTMVTAVLKQGRIPVVPTIPWGADSQIQACGPRANAEIEKLYGAYPQMVRGPDLWMYFKDNPSLIRSDGIHPTQAGYAAYSHRWAEAMLATVYGKPGRSTSRLLGVRVVGNMLQTVKGKHVVLRGVDRSGTEYACIQGWGIFDGPSNNASVKAMRKWGINGVNFGVNEDCWLGINGVRPAYAGKHYIAAIKSYVRTLERNHIYPVIALFWEAPGARRATGQISMPDADHATAVWKSIARTFRNDRRVIFRLKEEPFPAGNTDTHGAWSCWLSGGSYCNEGYAVVGMQSLVNAIRASGARNVIQVPGVEYANSMSNFLSYEPHDPLKDLMAVVDVYPDLNPCGGVACYDREYAPVIRQIPLMAGEFGESVNGDICGVGKSNVLMSWLDAHHSGYFAWTWDTWGRSCGDLSLILSYAGVPKSPNGKNFRRHLLEVLGKH